MAKAGDFLKKFGYNKKPKFSSGILPLDIILNGGMKFGGCYAIGSPSQGGKSTLTLQICKFLCDSGKFVYYFDIEQGVDENQIEGAGLSKYLEPLDGEDYPRFGFTNEVYRYSDFQNAIRDIVELKKQGIVSYDFIIADSLSSLVSETIEYGDAEAATYAADARPLAKTVKSLRGMMGVNQITLWNIVQAASNIGGTQWEPEWVAKMTKALEHAVDALIIIEHPTAKSYKIWGKKRTPNGDEDVEIGYYGKLYTTKSRKGLNRVKVVVPMIMGKGLDNVQYLMNTLLSTGVFVKGTKYYKYNDANGIEQRIEGEDNYRKFVLENYATLVDMMNKLGFFDLTNDATIQNVATIEPSDVAGANVSEEELRNETNNIEDTENANDKFDTCTNETQFV